MTTYAKASRFPTYVYLYSTGPAVFGCVPELRSSDKFRLLRKFRYVQFYTLPLPNFGKELRFFPFDLNSISISRITGCNMCLSFSSWKHFPDFRAKKLVQFLN